jgi:hypothetical protein
MKSSGRFSSVLRPVAGALLLALMLALPGAIAAPAPPDRGESTPTPTDASGAVAAEPAVQPAETDRAGSGDEAAPVLFVDRPDAELSPLMRDLKAAWLEHLTAQRELEARRDAAADETTYLEAQRAIEELQMALERTFLVIQIDHARRDGREADLQELEAALQRHDSPPVLRAKVERSRPSAGGR